MKQVKILIIILLPAITFAQSKTTKEIDSIVYYQKQINLMWRSQRDSLINSAKYKLAKENIDRIRSNSENYGSFVIFTDILHSNLTSFNTSIKQSGFTEMQPISYRLGFGASSKNGNTMFDFYFVTAGFNSKATKGEETIKLSLSNFFQFDLGYAIIHSKSFNLYPYAGLSLRMSTLDYKKPIQVNNSYTNISNIIVNNQSIVSSSTKVGYQLGLGLDVLVSKNNTESGTYLFTKIGINESIGKNKYSIAGIDYQPDIKQGDWLVSIGFKFANWH